METTLIIAALKVVGYGLGAIGPGIGIGIACYGCCVGSARQPELAGRLFTNFIIGAALAEALPLSASCSSSLPSQVSLRWKQCLGRDQ